MATQQTVTRGSYPKGIARRQQMIEAAARVFARHGYAAGSLRTIAAEVGVTSAALVRYFGHKEGLLTAVVEYWADQYSAARNAGTGLEHFRRLPELMQYHTEHRGFMELFLTLASEASNPEHPARDFIVNRYEKTLGRFCDFLREAREAGDVSVPEERIESEARGLIALMDGIELQWLLNPEVDLVGEFSYQLDGLIDRWTAGLPNRPREAQPEATKQLV